MNKESDSESYETALYKQGYFICSHGLINMVQDDFITRAAYRILHVLLHFENRKTETPNEWFECKDRDLYKTKLVSAKLLKAGRIELQEKELIEFIAGSSHKDTRYRILIPGKYYYKDFIDFDS